MNFRTALMRVSLGSLALLILAAPASAALFRSYLSVEGSDVNPCTVQLPCRLLPAALAAVNDGGEIWMLDSANFNTSTVSITKSVSILAIPGAVGSVVANGSAAISINAPASSVRLNHLSIRSLAGPTHDGIAVVAVGSLLVDNVAIEGVANGLYLTGPAAITIRNSLFRANSQGIQIYQQGGAEETVSIDNTSFVDNDESISALTASTTGFLRVTLSNSVLTGTSNTSVAFGGAVAGAAPVIGSLVRTRISGRGPSPTGTGLMVFGALSVVTMSDCQITGYYYGARTVNGLSGVGTLRSMGNNMFNDVTTNGSFTLVPLQ